MDLFSFNTDLSVLVCKVCHVMVSYPQVSRHLSESALHFQEDKQAVLKQVKQYEGQAKEVKDVIWPLVPIKSLDGLPIYSNGLACKRCEQVFRCRSKIAKHVREHHLEVERMAHGGDRKSKHRQVHLPWRSNVSCQQLLRKGSFAKYFEVQIESNEIERDAFPDIEFVKRQKMEAVWNAVESRKHDDEKETYRYIQEHDTSRTSDTWLIKTRWPEYLKKKSRPYLISLLRKPDKDDDALVESIETCLRSNLKEAFLVVRDEIPDLYLFLITNSYLNEVARKPMSRTIERATMERYVDVICTLARYVLRTWTFVHPENESEREEDSANTPPRYTLSNTHRQSTKALIAQFAQQGGEWDTTKKMVVDWFVGLWDSSYGTSSQREHENVVLSWLAVLAVERDGTFHRPYSYTTKLAATMRCVRALVLLQGWRLSKENHRSSIPFDFYEWTKEQVLRYLCVTKPIPMDWLLRILTYGQAINKATPRSGNVDWLDEETLSYEGVKMNRGMLQTLVHGLVYDANKVLYNTILYHDTPPSIPWATLAENSSNTKLGFNFIQDDLNAPYWGGVVGEKWLRDRLWNTQRATFWTGETWNKKAVHAWCGAVNRFKECLLLLCHLTGGQPARGTELLTVRYRNSATGQVRNVFIQQGSVVFVTEYHKSLAVTRSIKSIHRFLPREVGELMVYYLWLVIPLQHHFETCIFQMKSANSFLWPEKDTIGGNKWTSDRLSKLLEKCGKEKVGQDQLRVATYRHVAIALARKFLHPFVSTMMDDEEEGENSGVLAIVDEARDLQAGHGTRTAGLTYARNVQEDAHSTFSLREQYQETSILWHDLLGFVRQNDRHQLGKRGRMGNGTKTEKQKQDVLYAERIKQMRQVDLKQLLQRIHGDKAEFKGSQERVLQAIMQGTQKVFAIMATGAGKSLLFQIPALWEEARTTIVVTPLVVLRKDLVRRCNEMGIPSREWADERPCDDTRIVLVTPELATSLSFRRFVWRLNQQNKLDRVCLDECHMLLEADTTFRYQFFQLKTLLHLSRQVVMLSATVPPQELAEIYKRLEITSEDAVLEIRQSTSRPNLAYHRQEWNGQLSNVPKILEKACAKHGATSKFVLFVQNKNHAKELAKLIGIPSFTGETDAARRTSILQQFHNGMLTGVVATTAFGAGVDVRDIRVIIHVGWPFSLRNFAQEAGRAGRDGLQSDVITLDPKGGQTVGQGDVHVKAYLAQTSCRRKYLDLFLDGKERTSGCDGNKTEPEAKCDLCTKRYESEQAQKKGCETLFNLQRGTQRTPLQEAISAHTNQRLQTFRHEKTIQYETKSRTDLSVYLNEVARSCLYCDIRQGKRGGSHHRLANCLHLVSKYARQQAGLIASQINLRQERFVACYSCGWPQWFCEAYTSDGTGGWNVRTDGIKSCQYPNELFESLLIISAIVSLEKRTLTVQCPLWGAETSEWIKFIQKKAIFGHPKPDLLQGVKFFIQAYQNLFSISM